MVACPRITPYVVNNPLSRIDPDGRSDVFFMVRRTGTSAVSGGTIGSFQLISRAGELSGRTLERPTREDDPGNKRHPAASVHGRIPEGVFPARGEDPDARPAMHPSLRLDGVPGFTGILVHAGSQMDNSEGCILAGDTLIAPKRGNSELLNTVETNRNIHENISEAFAADAKAKETTRIRVIVVDPPKYKVSPVPTDLDELPDTR
jgi:hypothetical protein